jgi:glycosyltransferase involved in cell wall biosynthesis
MTENLHSSPHIVVLIPCLNEAQTIAKVIGDFQKNLPEAEIIVFDNQSDDQTFMAALEAGARVVSEMRRGKGFVIQSMFRDIEADIYIMVDGDDTYPAERVRALVDPILKNEADMVIGSRITPGSNSRFSILNWWGNKFFLGLINMIFGARLTDILSGYRAMNRRLVKSLPLFEHGFGIEAELTIKALERGFRLQEAPVDLRNRVEGSYSKIRIVRDGLRILLTIFALFRDYKPLTFFGGLGLFFSFLGCLVGLLPLVDFMKTGGTMPLIFAVFGGLVAIGGMLNIGVGLILHTLNRRFQEMEHFTQLNLEKGRLGRGPGTSSAESLPGQNEQNKPLD